MQWISLLKAKAILAKSQISVNNQLTCQNWVIKSGFDLVGCRGVEPRTSYLSGKRSTDELAARSMANMARTVLSIYPPEHLASSLPIGRKNRIGNWQIATKRSHWANTPKQSEL